MKTPLEKDEDLQSTRKIMEPRKMPQQGRCAQSKLRKPL